MESLIKKLMSKPHNPIEASQVYAYDIVRTRLPTPPYGELLELLAAVPSLINVAHKDLPSSSENGDRLREKWSMYDEKSRHRLLSDLTTLLDHDDVYLASHVGVILCDIGEEAIPPIAGALENGEMAFPETGLSGLRALGATEEHAPLVQRFLTHEHRAVQLSAIACLESIGPPATVCTTSLIDLLDHDDDELVSKAAAALAHINPDAAMEPIRIAMRRWDEQGRWIGELAASLVVLGSRGAQILVNLATRSDEGLRFKVVDLLGDCRPPEPLVIATLARAMVDDSEQVRRCAGYSLRGLGTSVAPDVVKMLRKADTPPKKRELCGVLGSLFLGKGKDEESFDAIHGLMRLLSDGDPEVQFAAAQALCIITPRMAERSQIANGLTDDQESAGRDICLAAKARLAALEAFQSLASDSRLDRSLRDNSFNHLRWEAVDVSVTVGASASRMEIEREAKKLVPKFRLFIEVLALYKQGVRSYNAAAEQLVKDLSHGRSKGVTPVSAPSITRCMKILNAFFSKVLKKPDLKLFDNIEGQPSSPTADAERAVAWIEEFLQRRSDL